MPLQIIRQDITKIECDAIVNAANQTLLGGGGVDGAIHKAAGKGLLFECMRLGGCKTGQAKITKAYKLPSKFVIHTVGPKWKGGNSNEEDLLKSCYKECLKLATENNCESVAFPLISSGAYGYPKDRVLKVAVDMITEFLLDHDMLVYIVVFDKSAFQISEKLFAEITSYIDEKYVDTHFDFNRTRSDISDESTLLAETRILPDSYETNELQAPKASDVLEPSAQPKTSARLKAPARPRKSQSLPGTTDMPREKSVLRCPEYEVTESALSPLSLDEAVNQLDESFSQMLLRKIDEKGLKDSECYKRANVDRKLFSKIRSDANYKTSKTTAIAFAIALELTLDETKDFLMKAGFALSHSNKFDVIIEYFIKNGNYNVFEINEALFAFDQSLLG